MRLRAIAAVVLAIASCSSSDGDAFVEAEHAAALAPLPDGGLLIGERLTGRILRADADGQVSEVATLDVRTDGEQRGLLGVAVDPEGAIYASSTRAADGRIVVEQVSPSVREVWVGPESRDIANGGHLEVAPNGRLVIGLGSLGGDDVIDDPSTLNGKLLALDPDGDPSQEPVLIAGGFHNPFAFDVDTAGRILVADNSPGDEPERLILVTRASSVVLAEIEPHTVASGLAWLDDDTVAICTYLGETLQLWDVSAGSAEPTGEPLAEDCKLGAVELADGRLAYATETEIEVLAAP